MDGNDVRLEGLTVVADPPSAALEYVIRLTFQEAPVLTTNSVVFVHGFTGHPRRTWTYNGEVSQEDGALSTPGNSSERPSKVRRLLGPHSSKKTTARKTIFWPQDLLPTTLPNARISTYGYSSNIHHRFGTPGSKNTVYDLAKDLLLIIEAKRQSQASRPLIFIAHSLGGIVVKEMLRQSEGYRTHQCHLHSVYDATVALIYFGTPHSGADPRGAIHRVAEIVLRTIGFIVNEQLVNSLLPSSERLKELRDEFARMSRAKNWTLYSFQEQYGLKILDGKKVRLNSARLTRICFSNN
jgi:pimeloyl-ACP methyl ester carboxylesterase